MIKDFYDSYQARFYLKDCVLKFKDEPIYIDEVDEYFTVFYRKLIDNIKLQINIKIEKFDIYQVDLGWINTQVYGINKTLNISRKPVRAWKLGLSSSNCKILPHYSVTILQSKYMYNMVKNIYPGYDKALELSKDNNSSCAFSRTFSIKQNKLYHNLIDVPIGDCNKKNIELYDDFSYIKESLNRDLT